MNRVVVFIDAQNFYHSARRAFFVPNDPATRGQFHPRALGDLLASRDADRTLVQVRLYTGRPDAYLQPKSYAANVRQCQRWMAAGCYVFQRPLRYPHNWPNNSDGKRPEEKGIDVAIALDLVKLGNRGEYDTAILCSADTDLIPAVDEVVDGDSGCTVEVAGWRHDTYRQRLSFKDRNIWCHWLSLDDYNLVCDGTDYAASD
jgi:uncharacterized LabA/DUF88 family protein